MSLKSESTALPQKVRVTELEARNHENLKLLEEKNVKVTFSLLLKIF